MAFLPQRLLRLTGFTSTYLTSTAGSNGEIYYDSTTKSLRVYDGGLKGGYQLARSDLTNITNTAFANKATAAGVGLAPTWTSIVGKPAWTSTPFIKVAADDSTVRVVNFDETIVITGTNGITTASDSEGEITITGPNLAVVATTGNYTDLSNRPNLATVATSGSYTDLTNTPAPVSLTGYATENFVNTQISNLVDGAPSVLNTLNELAAAINDDSTFAGTVFAALDSKASLVSPTFYGTATFTDTPVPFSIDSFSHSANVDRVSVSSGEGMFWKPDGTRFYIHDNVVNDIFEYICSEAWNPSTATAGLTLDYSSQKNAISGSLDMRAPIYIKPDGTAIYIMGSIGPSDYMFYTLALNSPWSISSATLTLSSGTITGTPITGFTFKPDGDKVYVSAGGITSQFDLATAWDLNSVLAPTGFNQSNYLPGSAYGGGIAFNDTGSKIYYVNLNGGIFSFDLTTPYAITSTVSGSLASFDLTTISTFSYAGSGSVQWSSDGTKMFIGGQNNSFSYFVWRYNSSSETGTLATDILTVSTDYHQGSGTNADLGNGVDCVFGIKTQNNGNVAVIQSDTGSAGLKVVGTGTGLGIVTVEGNGYLSLVSPDSTNGGGIEADRGTLGIRGAQKALDGSLAAQDIVLYTNYNQTALTITGTSRLVTVNNDLTVSGLGRFSYQNISPAGSTQGTATAITANLVMILNTAPSGGIRLPASQPYGTRILVRNSAAGSRSVYPPTGEEILGAGAVNSAISHAGLSWREYIKTANPLGSGADFWWVLTPT